MTAAQNPLAPQARPGCSEQPPSCCRVPADPAPGLQILNDWFNKHHLDRKALAALAANQTAAEAYQEHVADEIEAVMEGLIQAIEGVHPQPLAWSHPPPGVLGGRTRPVQPLQWADQATGSQLASVAMPAASSAAAGG